MSDDLIADYMADKVMDHDLLENECRHPDEYELCFFIHFKGKVYRYDIEVECEPTFHAKFTRMEPNREQVVNKTQDKEDAMPLQHSRIEDSSLHVDFNNKKMYYSGTSLSTQNLLTHLMLIMGSDSRSFTYTPPVKLIGDVYISDYIEINDPWHLEIININNYTINVAGCAHIANTVTGVINLDSNGIVHYWSKQ